MLASPYREHMLACLSDGLLALKDEARPPETLVHACEQRSSFACAALGTFLYAGAKPLSHGDLTRAEVRPAQSRVQGAKALRRACALDNVSACALLARILSEDPTTQTGTGYNPAQIKAYANPSFEGERRGDDTNL